MKILRGANDMKDFFKYYQEELLFLRERGGIFAKKYPEIAELIDLKNSQSTDPQTERIIESVAFLSAKLHQKIDDNSQSIAYHLLDSLYPHLIDSFPPCSISQFCATDNNYPVDIINVPRHSILSSRTQNDIICRFQTIYDIEIYPIKIDNISLRRDNRSIGGSDLWTLNIKISTNSIPIENIPIDNILFHINSNMIEDALIIYEAIFSDKETNVFLRINDNIIKLPTNSIKNIGFEDDETIVPLRRFQSNIFHMFQEILHFKHKFMFFRVYNIIETIKKMNITSIESLEIIIDITYRNEKLQQIVNKNSILLNCVPIVNLFPVMTDPFRFSNTQNKYLLVADQTKDRELEIHSILDIHMIDSEDNTDRIVQPYFSLNVDSDTNNIHKIFWIRERESSEIRNLEGFDTYISFIDIEMNPYRSYNDVVYARTLCMNRFESRDIPINSSMETENIESGEYIAKLLYKTTKPIEFSKGSTKLWNLVSQLSSSHISIANKNVIFENIKKLIEIFSSGISIRVDELISNISNIDINNIVRRFGNDSWRGFIRGIEVKIYIKDYLQNYYSFILGCVINQYLSSIISINTFIELSIINENTHEVLSKWKPTSGRKELI